MRSTESTRLNSLELQSIFSVSVRFAVAAVIARHARLDEARAAGRRQCIAVVAGMRETNRHIGAPGRDRSRSCGLAEVLRRPIPGSALSIRVVVHGSSL